jgi:hypothetical protein
MSDTNTPPRVWLAIIRHKHGVNGYAAVTEQQLFDELAGFCRDWWMDAVERDPQLPAQPPLDEREIVERYFEAVEDEQLDLVDVTLSGAALVVDAVPAPAAGRAGQRRLIVAEFLSGSAGETEEDAEEDPDDLAVLVDAAVNGDLSMAVLADATAEIDGPTLARLAIAQGTDPDFFGVDADGHPLEER